MKKNTKTMRKGQNKTASSASKSEVENLRKQVQKLSVKASAPFANVGAHLGNMVGFKDVGRGVGSFVGKILGSGDYTTNFSSVTSNGLLTASVPSFGGQSTVIIHREYITDIVSSSTAGAFNILALPLNPGLASSFPWLSVLAQNYEEYDINGMIFEFKTMSGESVASTNTSLGSVILTTQYDSTRAGFSDKQEMENHMFSQSCKPSESVLHAVECNKGITPVKTLYVRSGAPPSQSDLRWTDFGNFYIATVGLPGTSVNVGELWVSYKITLRKPRIPVGGLTYFPQVRESRLLATNALPLGTTSVISKLSLLNYVSTTNTISFTAAPTEFYMINIKWYGTAVAWQVPGFSYINLAGNTDLWYENGSTAFRYTPSAGVTTARCEVTSIVQCTSFSGPVTATITLDGTGTLPGSIIYCDIFITAITPGLN
jgi:hypothetical protein